MKVRIAIEQVVDVDEILSNDIEFEMFAPENLTYDDKVDYLVNRFCEDIDSLVKYNEVREQILVEYIED
jgi:hypothetical protein